MRFSQIKILSQVENIIWKGLIIYNQIEQLQKKKFHLYHQQIAFNISISLSILYQINFYFNTFKKV